MTPRPAPRSSAAERFYRRLLRLLPPDFRGDFAHSMASDFRDRDRELHGAARRRLHAREILGLVSTTAVQWADAAGRDVRYALRMMRRTPGFTLAAIVMLAIGTGTNAAMFSVVDSVLLRPAATDPARIVQIQEETRGKAPARVMPASHLERFAAAPQFTGVAGMTGSLSILSGVGAPHRIEVDCVSASLFPIMGVAPTLGRVFTPSEDRAGGDPVVVLAYRTWQDDFGGREDIVGRQITLNGASNTVIGVMPEGFLGPLARNRTGAWAPLAPSLGHRSPSGCQSDRSSVEAIARVRAPLTIETATAEADAAGLGAGLTAWSGAPVTRIVLARADDFSLGVLRTPLVVLLGAVGCVLLIACANVANLQIERLVGRRREVAIRLAVGATRGRLVRQTIVENLLLGALGAAAGLLAARLTIHAVVALLPAATPHVAEIAVNGRTLAATMAAALVSSLAVGLVPAIQAARPALVTDLMQGGRGSVGGAAWTRRSLVVVEIALSVVLLVSAGLMVRTFLILRPVDPGFESANRTVAEMLFSGDWVIDPVRERTVDGILERVAAIPGVASASASTYLPLSGSTDLTRVRIGGAEADVWSSWSTPDYFREMDMRLERGRRFTAADDAGAPPVAIVNAAMAEQFWPDRDPIGQVIGVRTPDHVEHRMTIVGVLATARSWGTDIERRSELLMPYAQGAGATLIYFVVQTNGAPGPDLPSRIRAIVSEVRPGQIVERIEPLQTKVDRSVAAPRFAMWLFGVFAAAGAALAALGLAAVVAWWVSARRREIGVRMALGASVGQVAALVLREGLALAVVGLVVGIGTALGVTRLLSNWLYGVAPPTDPLTFVSCASAMLAITALATYIPARRAARIDPLQSLRAE